MHHRDKLRRRLLPVRFAGDPGDGAISANDRDAGELRSHRDGHGLAWLRVELADAPLVMNGAPVTPATTASPGSPAAIACEAKSIPTTPTSVP